MALLLTLGLAASPAQTAMPAGQTWVKMLIDRDVYSADDVQIGEIEDLLPDAEGRVVSDGRERQQRRKL